MARKWVSVAIQLAEFLICNEGNRTEKFWIYPLLDNGITQMVSVAMLTKFSQLMCQI